MQFHVHVFLAPLVARDLCLTSTFFFVGLGCANSVNDRGLVERSSERGFPVVRSTGLPCLTAQAAISGNLLLLYHSNQFVLLLCGFTCLLVVSVHVHQYLTHVVVNVSPSVQCAFVGTLC